MGDDMAAATGDAPVRPLTRPHGSGDPIAGRSRRAG